MMFVHLNHEKRLVWDTKMWSFANRHQSDQSVVIITCACLSSVNSACCQWAGLDVLFIMRHEWDLSPVLTILFFLFFLKSSISCLKKVFIQTTLIVHVVNNSNDTAAAFPINVPLLSPPLLSVPGEKHSWPFDSVVSVVTALETGMCLLSFGGCV